jgi:hypothetical protein
MSSVTVLFVLDEILRRHGPRPGEKGVLGAFGPGFCAEFALLEFFMRHPGEVLSRRQLVEHVWDFAFEGDPHVVVGHRKGRGGGHQAQPAQDSVHVTVGNRCAEQQRQALTSKVHTHRRAGASVHIDHRSREVTGANLLQQGADALDGHDGRLDIRPALESRGQKWADRYATRTLGKLHAKGSVKRIQDGRYARYWVSSEAPQRAE